MSPPRGAFPRRSHPSTPKRRSGITMQESITLKEIKEGSINERVVKLIECLSASISGKSDDAGHISLNITADFIQSQPNGSDKKIQEVEETPEDIAEVVQALEDSLKKHLEKVRRVSLEVKKQESLVKANELKQEDSEDDQSDDEPELEVALTAHLSKKKRLSEETSSKKKNLIGQNENAINLESPGNKVGSGKNESAKKVKKHKRTNSETLNNTSIEEVLTKTKKQKSAEAPTVVSAPEMKMEKSKQKHKHSIVNDPTEKLNIQTPKANKKKNKHNRNSISETTPPSEKTSDNKIDVLNTSVKSSKKKRKSQKLQESDDYLPLSL